MQHPLLYLGLIGFEPEDELRLRHGLELKAQQIASLASQTNAQRLIWRVVDFQEADALLICGAGVQQGWGSHLEFSAALQRDGAPLGLDLNALKQPFALSDQARLCELGMTIGKPLELNTRQDDSIARALIAFETMLRPLHNLYALALELTARQSELDANHTYHWSTARACRRLLICQAVVF